MGSTVELNISVGVTTVDCCRMRIVADVFNVESSVGSTVELNIWIGVTTVDCYRLRIVADVFNVDCSWVQL